MRRGKKKAVRGTWRRFYHGGVPEPEVQGRLLVSAARLGMKKSHENPMFAPPPYDPAHLYLTTHLGSALGFAARYRDAFGRTQPGDVYEVEPIGSVLPDPDYGLSDVFWMCAQARIVRIARRGVQLSLREQSRHAWPYRRWDENSPVQSEDGTFQLSAEMRANGVTDEYAALLPKWLDPVEIGNSGRITSPTDRRQRANAVDLVEVFGDHLDQSTHAITRTRLPNVAAPFVCTCGAEFAGYGQSALHQMGELQVHAVAYFNFGDPRDMEALIAVLAQRSPERWSWYRPDEHRWVRR
jgi:hypothetical protein